MKPANTKPTSTHWILASMVICENTLLIVAIAPDIRSTFIRRIAPKMIIRISEALKNPSTVSDDIFRRSIFQTAAARIAANSQESGIALFAGQENTVIRITHSRIGPAAARVIILKPSPFSSFIPFPEEIIQRAVQCSADLHTQPDRWVIIPFFNCADGLPGHTDSPCKLFLGKILCGAGTFQTQVLHSSPSSSGLRRRISVVIRIVVNMGIHRRTISLSSVQGT